MLPQTQARKTRNSSKVNLIISLVFHGALVFVALYFAARSGILGDKAKNLTVYKVKEPAKPKEPEKKPDEPKPDDTPKPTIVPKMTVTQPTVAPTPSTAVAPAASAPPAVDIPTFAFEGGQTVTSADPVTLYKSLIQESITAHWQRPEMGDKDKDFVAEMRVNVDSSGHITSPTLTKPSGNPVWDDSVSKAVAATTKLSHNPPKGFPNQVTIRFDVAEERQDSIFQ